MYSKTAQGLRVLKRYLLAMQKEGIEFETSKALKMYLKEHPDADPSKHSVKKMKKEETPKEKAPKGESGGTSEKKEESKKPENTDYGSEGLKDFVDYANKAVKEGLKDNFLGMGIIDKYMEKEPSQEKPKDSKPKSWKDRLTSLGSKAINYMKEAPEKVQNFFKDESYRRGVLMDMHAKLESAPAKAYEGIVHTVKHEVKEFKEAGQGIAAVLKGGKMDDHQKKALKTVGTHLAIGITAAALTATGPLGIAGTFTKGLARHIAAKAISNALGHLHVLDEIGHIGHGVKHLMEHLASEDDEVQVVLRRYVLAAKKGEKVDPEEVLTNFIRAAVTKEIKNLNDDDLEEGFKLMDSEKS